MKTFYRKTFASSLSLVILFLIIGTASAGYLSSEPLAIDAELKEVPYNINGVFTTVSGITYNSSSGEFATENPGEVYTVNQYDRMFTIMKNSIDSPLFFAIDDKQGKHFFSHKKNGNTTFFRSGIIESDNVFSTRMITSSGGVVKVKTALAVRNGALVPNRKTIPNLTGTWTTAQNSVYQINSQEGNVFSGRITAHGKTTSTRFAGYIDTVSKDGTVEIVMLCERGNFILGNLNESTRNITIPYVLYADGRVASSSPAKDLPEWAKTNRTVTQEYAKILNSGGITEDCSVHVRLLTVYDENSGRYTLASTSGNTTIGIVQEDNSFIEYAPETGLIRGFVKGNTKYDFLGGNDSAEVLVHNLKQKGGDSGEL